MFHRCITVTVNVPGKIQTVVGKIHIAAEIAHPGGIIKPQQPSGDKPGPGPEAQRHGRVDIVMLGAGIGLGIADLLVALGSVEKELDSAQAKLHIRLSPAR